MSMLGDRATAVVCLCSLSQKAPVFSVCLRENGWERREGVVVMWPECPSWLFWPASTFLGKLGGGGETKLKRGI